MPKDSLYFILKNLQNVKTVNQLVFDFVHNVLIRP